MRILFATEHRYTPQFTGGAQSSSHELALGLMELGHSVAAISQLSPEGWIGFSNRLRRRLTGRNIVSDRVVGYPVYRQWEVRPSVAEVVARERPDVALVQIGEIPLAAALREAGVPTLVYLRDVQMDELGGDPRELDKVGYIANSEFTADRFKQAFGIDAVVIPPLFLPERYRVKSSRGNVTFINPYEEKGVEVALQVAKLCPDIPFCFVESWSLVPDYKAVLLEQLKSAPNVVLKSRTNDMKSVYGAAKLILMPSQWEEAWGRVASEAHFSGIPVVASTRGGLPESVGPGGVLLAADAPAEEWAAVVRRLWSDDAYYREKSEQALAYSRRPQLDRRSQLQTLVKAMEDTIARTDAASPAAEAAE